MGKEQLSIGEAKALVRLLSGVEIIQPGTCIGYPIGEEVVIRAESAGNWFGELEAVDGDVVRLKNARRMWGWTAAKSISLSAVVTHGISRDRSDIAPALPVMWVKRWIEILPITGSAAESIRGAEDAVQR